MTAGESQLATNTVRRLPAPTRRKSDKPALSPYFYGQIPENIEFEIQPDWGLDLRRLAVHKVGLEGPFLHRVPSRVL
jgi:hypothetical protein